MSMDWKTQNCEDGNSPQTGLQLKCNPDDNPRML